MSPSSDPWGSPGEGSPGGGSPSEPRPRPGEDRDASQEAWGREAVAAFLLGLRGRGVRDLAVLRAVEGVPRPLFVPQRFRALAGKDMAFPLPCGQTMTEPFATVRAIEALRVDPDGRVLEIGCGSGYASAILGRLCRDVLAVERFRSLATEARMRLARVRASGVTVVWGDGLALPADCGLFDRILVHAEMAGVPPSLASRLKAGGVAVFARAGWGGADTRQWLVSAERNGAGAFLETPVAPCRIRPLLMGASQAL